MAFDATPSQLHRHIFWDVTLDDIKAKIKLHVGKEQALVVQQFQTLEKVVSMVFGPGEKQRPPEVQNKAELKDKFNKIFGGR